METTSASPRYGLRGILTVLLVAHSTALFTPEAEAQNPVRDLAPDPDPPIQTDRPTFSAGAALVPERSFQIELGFKHSNDAGGTKFEFGQVLMRYGLFRNTELRLAPNSFTVIDDTDGARDKGLEDIKISVKIGLIREAEGARPAVSLLPALSVETGHQDITNGASLPSLTLLLDWSLSESFALTSNLGWERVRADGLEFDKYSGSLVLSYPLTNRLSGYAEVYLFDRESPDGSTSSYFDLDLVYLISHTLSIDATLGSGLSGNENDYFVGLGLSKRW